MIKRSSIEVEPNTLKLIKAVVGRCGMKQKFVTDQLLRYALVRADYIFHYPKTKTTTPTKDNGK